MKESTKYVLIGAAIGAAIGVAASRERKTKAAIIGAAAGGVAGAGANYLMSSDRKRLPHD